MPTTQLFGFTTQATSGYLLFSYYGANSADPSTYYIPPPGTEEALFGNGVTLKVTMTWDGSVAKLYLNDEMVQQFSYTTPTPNWSAASNFDLGAYEYLTYGGYNASDDIIDEFTVTGPTTAPPQMDSSPTTSISDLEPSITPSSHAYRMAHVAAPAACSPEAVATLTGRFLPDETAAVSDRSGRATSLAGARVLINGSYTPVLYASPGQVDFLCPTVPPTTALAIAVETPRGFRTCWKPGSRRPARNPGYWRVDSRTGSHSPGGRVSIRATGLNWLAKFPTARLFVRIGTRYVPIESITPDLQSLGVSRLTVTMPSDISGDSIPAGYRGNAA